MRALSKKETKKCEGCGREFEATRGLSVHQGQSDLCKQADKIIELYEEGYSCKQVGERTGFTRSAIASFLRERGKTRTLSEAVNLFVDQGRGLTNTPDLEITADLAWIVGVLYCDGSCFRNSAGDYIASLYAVDKEFVDSFERRMGAIGLNCDRYFNKRDHENRNNLHEARVYSRKFYEWWDSLDQQRIEEIAREYPASFVGGVYDSDGSLSKRNRVGISRNDKWLLELVRELVADNVGVDFLDIYQRDNKADMFICKYQDVEKFCDWVDNTIQRKSIETRSKGCRE